MKIRISQKLYIPYLMQGINIRVKSRELLFSASFELYEIITKNKCSRFNIFLQFDTKQRN